MAESELRTLQMTEKRVLDEIDRVCKENDIPYILAGGTALGAVRHKGFIPWDDDIDIAMLLPDYDRFLAIAPEKLSNEFFLDNSSTDPEYAHVFSKVRLKGTKFVEQKGNPNAKHNEIFVDVFPYFQAAPDLKTRRKLGKKALLRSHLLRIRSGYRVWEGEGLKQRLKFLPLRILAAFTKKETLQKKMDAYMRRYSERTGIICSNCGLRNGYLKNDWPQEIFDTTAEVEFEGKLYPIAGDYDTYLRISYGDRYMELPPAEQRVTHRPLVIDFGPYGS